MPTPSDPYISVRAGTGRGRTALSAFHNALTQVGLAHYNLVRLSSVIPPDVGVSYGLLYETGGEVGGRWGDRLFCVYASRPATRPGQWAWAGIGWAQRLDGQGGLFVEHEGETREDVVADIHTSLDDMTIGEPAAYGETRHKVIGIQCADRPVCALVIAPYETASWHSL